MNTLPLRASTKPLSESISTPATRRITFRPDVEGLRGVALLLVFAFHFDVPYVSGGFIGVDVFYVISGFLIGSILQAAPTRDAQFVLDFYARRLKRLMPAYLVLALVVTAVCLVVLLPEDLLRYLQSLRETYIFRANRYFDRELSSYFAPSAKELPLLHTWSLSIEWQFYLIFPLCLIVVFKAVGERHWRLIATSAFILLAVASCYLTATRPGQYFLALPRAFEFVGGAAIAAWGGFALPTRKADALAFAGLAILIVAATSLTSASSFPGAHALLVFSVTAALIGLCRESRLMGNPFLAGIGKRSYSLYLWHWPVLAVAAHLQLLGPPATFIAVLSVVLVMSELSYRLVERPMTKRVLSFSKASIILWLAPLLATVALLQAARIGDGFPERFGAEYMRAYTNLRDAEGRLPPGCNEFSGATNPDRCKLGHLGSADRAILIGDSHARHFAAFIDVLAKASDVEVRGMFSGECLSLPGVSHVRHGTKDADCEKATNAYYDMIASGKYKYVFIAQRWIGYTEADLANLGRSLDAIARSGATPVLLAPIAENGQNLKTCLDRHYKLRETYDGTCKLSPDDEFSRDKKKWVDTLLADAARRRPPTIVIDAKRSQCNDASCEVVHDGTPIYGDLHHLTDYGSALLGRRHLQAVGNPLVQ